MDHDVLCNNQTSVDIFDYGARNICNETTKWLADKIEDAILDSKKEMKKLLPGSVLPGDPKVIYIKMLYRPKRSESQGLRNILNAMMENNLIGKPNHFIMEANLSSRDFDLSNQLTAEGKEAYWKIIDSQLTRFDKENDNERDMTDITNAVMHQKQGNTLLSTNNHDSPPITSQLIVDSKPAKFNFQLKDS